MYDYLVITKQQPKQVFKIVSAPDIATASDKGMVMLLLGITGWRTPHPLDESKLKLPGL